MYRIRVKLLFVVGRSKGRTKTEFRDIPGDACLVWGDAIEYKNKEWAVGTRWTSFDNSIGYQVIESEVVKVKDRR